MLVCLFLLAAPLRLVNGHPDYNCSGRVELYLQGQWGTGCDDGYFWGLQDAQVVCRQLGCGQALSVPGGAHFGEGSGPIWMSTVECSGSESSLTECDHDGIGSHSCDHSNDVGVICGEGECLRCEKNYQSEKCVLPLLCVCLSATSV